MQHQCALQVGAGIAAYNGDLIEDNKIFSQANYSTSVGLTYQFKPKWFFLADFSLLKVGASDKKNSSTFSLDRNLSFKTTIEGFDFGLEYDFLNTEKTKITPYLYGGIGLFSFNPYTINRFGVKTYLRNLGTEGQGYTNNKPFYLRTQVELPFGAGVKWAITKSVCLKADLRIRKIFTDYLDDVSTTYPDLKTISIKGNTVVNLAYRGDEVTLLPYPSGAARGNPDKKDIYYSAEIKACFKLRK